MNDYLTNLRRKRRLVTNLVIERNNIHQSTLHKQHVAVTYDQQAKLLLSHHHNGAQRIQDQRTQKEHARTRLKRLRSIKHKFSQHMATKERKTFVGWKEYANASIARKEEDRIEEEMASRIAAIDLELSHRATQQLHRLVADAHAPRRQGTTYQKSSRTNMNQKMYAAGRAYAETNPTALLKRVARGYDVNEKGRPKPTQLLIRPIPEILNPPHADQPDYPTLKLIEQCQKADGLYQCVLHYLNIPLERRNGQELVTHEINQERQAMTDQILFRQRQDGHGKGMETHLLERQRQRDHKKEEFILQEFHQHQLSLPIPVQKMMRLIRPLTLHPLNNCLYLCRRPDVPQALSLSTDKKIYLMGGFQNSPEDLLRTKLLVVPEAMQSSVLWWCYQESQQHALQQEQLAQSQAIIRASRALRRQEIEEMKILEAKMIHEGIVNFNHFEVVSEEEEQMLLDTEESDLIAAKEEDIKREKKLYAAAIIGQRKQNLKKMYVRDKMGLKGTSGTP